MKRFRLDRDNYATNKIYYDVGEIEIKKTLFYELYIRYNIHTIIHITDI